MQLGGEVGAVAALAIGQAEHAAEFAAGVNRQAGKGVQWRMARGQAGTARVLRRCVADQHLAAADDLAKQAVEVAKLQALRRVGVVKVLTAGIPGDIADGKGTQVGRALFIRENFANKAKLAVGEVDNSLEQGIEGFTLVVGIDVGGLRLADQREQVA